MWQWIWEGTLVAGVLALFAFLPEKILGRRPGLAHLSWLVVLICLVFPPLPITIPMPVPSPVKPWLDQVPLTTALKTADPEPMSRLSRGPSDDPGDATKAKPNSPEPREPVVATSGPIETDTAVYPGPELLSRFPWSSLAMGIILIIGTGLVGRQLAQTLRLRRLLARAPPAPSHLCRRVREVADGFGIAPPRVLLIPGSSSPFVFSFGRPVVVWPASQTQVTPGYRSVLVHELAHVHRKDHWVSWLEVAGMLLFWWHPLFLLARARIRTYAELACDAWAVRAFPEERRSFADALLEAADPSYRGAFAVAASGDKKSLKRRLIVIMQQRTRPDVSRRWVFLAILTLSLILPTRSWGHRDSALEPKDFSTMVEIHTMLAQAGLFQKAESWDKALRAYRKAASLAPESAWIQGRYGEALLAAGRASEAVRVFRRQIELGGHSEERFNLARALAQTDEAAFYTFFEDAVQAGFRRPDRLADKAFEPYEDDARFVRLTMKVLKLNRIAHEADDYQNHGEWDRVADAYRQFLEMAENSGWAWGRLGYALLKDGSYREGIAAYETQIAKEHRVATALYNIACGYSLLEDRQTALDYLERAIDAGFHNLKLMENDRDLDNLRNEPGFEGLLAAVPAVVHKHAWKHLEGDYQTLEAALVDLDAEGRFSGKAFAELGLYFNKKKRYTEAAAAFRKQVEHGHSVSRGIYNAACMMAKAGDQAAALDLLEHAVEAGFWSADKIARDRDLDSLRGDTRFRAALNRAGRLKLMSEYRTTDWDEAIDRGFAKIDDHKGWNKAGLALLAMGEYDHAIKAFGNQIDLGGSFANANYNIACAYARMGRTEEALASLELAVESDSKIRSHMRKDPDLDILRADPRFEEMLKRR